jgi:predicted nucleotidyltransferase
MINEDEKRNLKRELVGCLKAEKEVRRIVIFGSFLNSANPHDIDVAVFQNSNDQYLPLALKYRKMTRRISSVIPLDIIPIRSDASSGFMMDEIKQGEVIYERRS